MCTVTPGCHPINNFTFSFGNDVYVWMSVCGCVHRNAILVEAIEGNGSPELELKVVCMPDMDTGNGTWGFSKSSVPALLAAQHPSSHVHKTRGLRFMPTLICCCSPFTLLAILCNCEDSIFDTSAYFLRTHVYIPMLILKMIR